MNMPTSTLLGFEPVCLELERMKLHHLLEVVTDLTGSRGAL